MDDSEPDVPLSADSYGDSVAAVEYDREADVYRVTVDLDHPEPFAYVVVDAVASVTGRDPERLAPLQAVVEAEAIDALLASAPSARVTFEYAGCSVTATGEGQVLIGPPTGEKPTTVEF